MTHYKYIFVFISKSPFMNWVSDIKILKFQMREIRAKSLYRLWLTRICHRNTVQMRIHKDNRQESEMSPQMQLRLWDLETPERSGTQLTLISLIRIHQIYYYYIALYRVTSVGNLNLIFPFRKTGVFKNGMAPTSFSRVIAHFVK